MLVNVQRNIIVVLLALLAAAFEAWLYSSHLGEFWKKDLEPKFPSSAWLVISSLLTALVFVLAYLGIKFFSEKLKCPLWFACVSAIALSITVLNFLTGILFARLNGLANVGGFPLSRPADMIADHVFLFIAGSMFGLGIWAAGYVPARIVSSAAGDGSPQAE